MTSTDSPIVLIVDNDAHMHAVRPHPSKMGDLRPKSFMPRDLLPHRLPECPGRLILHDWHRE